MTSDRTPRTTIDPRPVRGNALDPADLFDDRHIGPSDADTADMLTLLGYDTLDALTDTAVPRAIRLTEPLTLGPHRSEHGMLAEFKRLAGQNHVFRSCIGQGYVGTIVPGVIQRNILENPQWYTQYTPYQAEISQGRLEALLNFQTMCAELTGLPLAGASLLDEGTAAAEAVAMAAAIAGQGSKHTVLVASDCHPQTIAVIQTRAEPVGVAVEVVNPAGMPLDRDDYFAVVVAYPATDGVIRSYAKLAEEAHAKNAVVIATTDLLALTQITPPGAWGADIAVGSAQRFGVPMGFGGPHAAFFCTHEKHARKMPGRIIGVSKDAQGNPALRMAIQTREQHIKRDRATSNICTAQALLAIMSGMYGVYHGPQGLRNIGQRVRALTATLITGLRQLGHGITTAGPVFDTIRVKPTGVSAEAIHDAARARRINLRAYDDNTIGITLDETSDRALLVDLLAAFAEPAGAGVPTVDEIDALHNKAVSEGLMDLVGFERPLDYMAHPVFNTHHSETEMLRYITKLQRRDLSLADSMISLGSCTMKLNATAEMVPVTWPEIGSIHPFAPADQTVGYRELFANLEDWLAKITGFDAVSLMPNAGAQGEYAGLLVIRAYHHDRGEAHRNICLIPESAHGTNPASAVMCGMKVVVVKCDEQGNIDFADLEAKADQHAASLAALMVTYPSTHGVFEENIKDICQLIHDRGGQVYMDGANLNAQVGLTSPGVCGADVCHLNLHKTFCIPHGGGGPGMGPIGVAKHLAPYLPTHPVTQPRWDDAQVGTKPIGPVSAAPYGSPSILAISYMYIAMMGHDGLKKATQVAILNANYMAKRLEKHYKVLYRGKGGLCAHEFIIDCRPFEKSAGIKIDDIAKRLIDYGFHAPTMSWPVAGTLMIEPTESEPKAELDRFCDAMIAIREEIATIERGEWPQDDNPLKHAPHTVPMVTANEWRRPYSREVAAYPKAWLREGKFWPFVARVDNAYGDRNLVCTCPSVGEFAQA